MTENDKPKLIKHLGVTREEYILMALMAVGCMAFAFALPFIVRALT